MVIKQKNRNNKALISYTDDELSTLVATFGILFILDFVASFVNLAVEIICSKPADDGQMITVLLIAIVGIVVLWLLILLVTRILGPLVEMALRHLNFPAYVDWQNRPRTIRQALAGWYMNVSYFKLTSVILVNMIINIDLPILCACTAEVELVFLYSASFFALVSVIALIAALVGACSTPNDTPDIKVIPPPGN